MDGCNTSKKVIIVPQKERIIRTNFFVNEYTTAEINNETMGNYEIARQNKYCIIQSMEDYHSFCDRNRYST